MGTRIKTFLLEPTNVCWASLRRYSREEGKLCANTDREYHNADFKLGEMPVSESSSVPWDQFPKTDPRWPTKCDACDYVFKDSDNWQLFQDRIWIRKDTGEKHGLRNPPIGAVYRATWHEPNIDCGPGQQAWICVVPGKNGPHFWHIDGRASNCTMPQDKAHRCWVRHGVAPDFHVDKNGLTCQAGAGSIQTSGWHGFLHNGYLVGD